MYKQQDRSADLKVVTFFSKLYKYIKVMFESPVGPYNLHWQKPYYRILYFTGIWKVT